jgi:hypothetical protein
LVALVVLIVALAIGYGVRAAHHDDAHPSPSPAHSTSLGALAHRQRLVEAD